MEIFTVVLIFVATFCIALLFFLFAAAEVHKDQQEEITNKNTLIENQSNELKRVTIQRDELANSFNKLSKSYDETAVERDNLASINKGLLAANERLSTEAAALTKAIETLQYAAQVKEAEHQYLLGLKDKDIAQIQVIADNSASRVNRLLEEKDQKDDLIGRLRADLLQNEEKRKKAQAALDSLQTELIHINTANNMDAESAERNLQFVQQELADREKELENLRGQLEESQKECDQWFMEAKNRADLQMEFQADVEKLYETHVLKLKPKPVSGN